MIASASPPPDPSLALLARANAALQLLRREPDLDRCRCSRVVAPTERTALLPALTRAARLLHQRYAQPRGGVIIHTVARAAVGDILAARTAG